MGKAEWSVVGRLKKAVKKLNSLLSLDLTKWRLSCFLRRASRRWRPTLSFNDRLGLHGCLHHEDINARRSPVLALHRVTSYGGDHDDVDKRAEIFISNFHRQLWLERQVSLELRYCRSKSSDTD